MTSLARLTDYSIDEQPNYFDIRTERLDPIVSSSFRYQFRLDPAAFMDRNSMLLFKVSAKDAAAAARGLRVNCFNGILGAVKHIELQIGDHTVQRIDNVNQWATLNNLYNLPVSVQEKVMSHYLKQQVKYEVSSGAGVGPGDVTGVIKPDNTNSGFNWGQSDSGAGAAVNSLELSDSAHNNELCGIPLGVLCPMLQNQEFPLFLFQEYKIHLTIQFESDASKYVNDKTANNLAGGERLAAASDAVVIGDVHLLVDYLIFPARVVDAVKAQTQKQGGYNFEFVNVENVQKTISAATANTTQQEDIRLNVVNQEVHYVQMMKQLPDSKFDKVCLGQRSDSISIEEYQFNVNGVDIYTEGFVSSPLEMYNNTTYVLGRDLAVPKPLCVADTNTQASLLSPSDMGISGKYKPICLDLRNGNPTVRGGGRVISEYPIRHIYKRKPHGEVTAADLATTPVIGQAENGILDVEYFLGVTRVVNVLAMPSGGNNVVVNDL
jgi:hypothetical protein